MLSASLAAIAATFLLTTAAGSNGGEDAPPRVPTAIDMILVDAVVTDRQARRARIPVVPNPQRSPQAKRTKSRRGTSVASTAARSRQ
jgi:hypothetical protein